MNKAIVIGGSNGLGLAISKKLIENNYYVNILDIVEPKDNIFINNYSYTHFNLLDINYDIIESLLKDNISVLIITAGVGRVSSFENLHIAEIEKMMTINATSTIKLLRLFYDKINSNNTFYCGVISSIAGIISSPLNSVYAASKSAIYRFIESVNIELEMNEVKNRILDVAPSYFDGSNFYGKETNIELLDIISNDILTHIFNRDTLYIPQFNETFKSVIESYNNDPHNFGIQSYKYKLNSGRVNNDKKVIIGYLSGTFDLFHIGHLNLLKKAKEQCDYLIVGVHNNGKWKGKETFIPFDERKQIVAACKYVDKVIDSLPEDSDVWETYHYNKLFVGSDYFGSDRFQNYEKFFRDKNVKIVYFPYTQSTSSTQIREAIKNNLNENSECSNYSL